MSDVPIDCQQPPSLCVCTNGLVVASFVTGQYIVFNKDKTVVSLRRYAAYAATHGAISANGITYAHALFTGKTLICRAGVESNTQAYPVINACIVSPDGEMVGVVSQNGTVYLHDHAANLLAVVNGPMCELHAISPDCNYMAAVDQQRHALCVWYIGAKNVPYRLHTLPQSDASCVAFSRDTRRVAVALCDGNVLTFSVVPGKPATVVCNFQPKNMQAVWCGFMPTSDSELIVASKAGDIIGIDTSSRLFTRVYKCGHEIRTCAISHTGDFIVIDTTDSNLVLITF